MTDWMRTAVLVEPGRFELRRVARPEPGPDEVLVRVARTGICGTDVHIFRGAYASERLPMVLGHEFTGHVAALGPNVEGIEEGQPVVVDMSIGCTRCYWCRRNEILNCPKMQQFGITIDGSFTEFLSVPARLVIPAPEHVAPAILALTEPLACVVRAARKSRFAFGQSVTVIGAGPIGNLYVQLMRTIGAVPIIVSDISPERVRIALDVGADIGVSDGATLKEAVMGATDGRGTDIVIECVGSPALCAEAQALVRPGGHLMLFGLTEPGESLDLDILRTILEENSVRGSVAGSGEDMHDALTLLAHDRIVTTPFTGASYPLDDIQAAFEGIANRPQHLKTQIVI